MKYLVSPVSSTPLVAEALAAFSYYEHAAGFAKLMSKNSKKAGGYLEAVIFRVSEASVHRVRIVIQGYYRHGREVLLVGDQEMDLRALMEKSLLGAEEWHAAYAARYAAEKGA
jgi:hypothetical protein